jgi:hypothetical protein
MRKRGINLINHLSRISLKDYLTKSIFMQNLTAQKAAKAFADFASIF